MKVDEKYCSPGSQWEWLSPLPSTQNYVLDAPVKVNSQTRAKEILEKRKQLMIDLMTADVSK